MKDFSIITKVFLILSIVVSAVLMTFLWMNIDGKAVNGGWDAIVLNWTYVLVGISGGATILFGLWNLIMFPKKAKSTLFGVIGLLVVFGLAYVLSSEGSVSANVMSKSEISLSTSHNVGMAIKAMYLLGLLAVLSIAYTEVSKIFK